MVCSLNVSLKHCLYFLEKCGISSNPIDLLSTELAQSPVQSLQDEHYSSIAAYMMW